MNLAERYGFTPKVCRPYRAQTEGKVERFNHYLKNSFVVPLTASLNQVNLLLDVEVAVGVVSTKAEAAKLSFDAGAICETASANTFADGLAVRRPIPEAFAIYAQGAQRIVSVSEAQIAEAMCVYYTDIHNLAEGAAAAALAALIQEREAMAGRRVGVILSGGNVDRLVYARVIE